jgi:hypothetical protein
MHKGIAPGAVLRGKICPNDPDPIYIFFHNDFNRRLLILT